MSASDSPTPNSAPNGAIANTIKLDQFLKWIGAAQTGGEAKFLIQDGEIQVNGKVETRRGRKLIEGDRVFVDGKTIVVKMTDERE
jgi:ribosome-associated protein